MRARTAWLVVASVLAVLASGCGGGGGSGTPLPPVSDPSPLPPDQAVRAPPPAASSGIVSGRAVGDALGAPLRIDAARFAADARPGPAENELELGLASRPVAASARLGNTVLSPFSPPVYDRDADTHGVALSWSAANGRTGLRAGLIRETASLFGAGAEGAFGRLSSSDLSFVGASGGSEADGWQIGIAGETGRATPQAAGGTAPATEGIGGQRPYYEIAADGETRERGGAGRIEFDAAFPIGLESRRNSALFLQPGAVLSQGPDGRALHGASLGIVFRFEAGGGIVGLNAFHDLNRISGSGRGRTHRQASLGADYQIGRSRIGANYYIPLTGRRGWESGQARLTEYAVGGPELRYRLALDDRWTLSGRAFRETGRGGWRGEGSGAGNGWRLAVGASYRLGCARVGLDIERDTRRGETAARLGLTFRLGAAAGRCAGEGKPDLLALVEREKIVAVRQAAVLRLVPLTSLPEDVTRLYDTVTGGDPDADTVWLFSQGGPVTELDSGSDLTEFPGHEKRILVNVHQVQTLNPGLIDDARLDSVARVQAEMDVSVEILDRVIRHFKARGKRVVVFSHSFGSFIVPRYLALKGPGAADRYVIMAGRLDIERKMYENRLSKLRDASTVAYFYEGGTTLTRFDQAAGLIDPDPAAPPADSVLPRAVRMQAAFQGALGKHRYTRLLASKDLSKVIYAYGTMDQAIGRLTGEEVAFLESRGAEVLAVEGGHGSMFAEPAAARIVELLEDLGRGPALFEGRGEACSRPCRRAVPERTAVRARVPEKAPSVR